MSAPAETYSTAADVQANEALVDDMAVAASVEPVRRTEAERAPTRAQHRPRAKPGSLLAARAATEYVYVSQDLKRISVVGALLFGVLFLLWLLIVQLRVIPLPFY